MRRVRLLVVLCLLCGYCPGCGSGIDVTPTRGVVQYEGKSLAGGRIILTPMHGGKPAFGTIQADGSFVLTTERTDDGAVPGKHRVTVVGDLKIQGKEVHMTFLAPREFSVEVVPDKKNDLLVNISQDDGWQETADD